MTNPVAAVYPLDLTGINPNNLVTNEPQSLLNNPNRAVVPNYGPFYTNGLVITDAANMQVLVPRLQYTCCQLIQDATLETGKEIMSVILITDTSVSSNVLITYQVLGGQYAYSTDALIAMLQALSIDDRAVSWGQIIGTPNAFPPTQHLHDVGDTYGWEYVVDAIDNLRQAILNGNQGAYDSLRDYVDAAMAAHIADHANPHVVTAVQVGLGPFATQPQAVAGTDNTTVMTPLRVAQAITALGSGGSSGLADHIADHANPHVVTATQVGLGSVQNYGIAAQNDATAGTSNVLYMTPLRVAEAIGALGVGGSGLADHIADHANPHVVTATQVGLGNCNNTSDAGKPVSTATQTALDLKADLLGNVTFATVFIGTPGNLRFNETTVGAMGIRTGTTGAFKLSTLNAIGDFSIPGKMIATGGFQPSDERFKDHIVDSEPRPLWREMGGFKCWEWNADNPFSHLPGTMGRGYVAQKVLQARSEFVHEFDVYDANNDAILPVKRLAVDQTAMALEMSAAAGLATDALHARIKELETQRDAQDERMTKLEALVKSLSKGE